MSLGRGRERNLWRRKQLVCAVGVATHVVDVAVDLVYPVNETVVWRGLGEKVGRNERTFEFFFVFGVLK